MDIPTFSVIIPVYNRETLLTQALVSVIEQSLPPLEIIVADDGSTDNTVQVAEEMLSRSSIDWKVLNLDHSGLAGKVRNRAVQVAKGDWIAFLDSDDLWDKKKLSYQANFIAENPLLRLVHTREVWQRGDRIISQKKQKHHRQGDIFEDALVKCIIGPSTTVMKRELFDELGGFDDTIEIAEDYELWLRVTSREAVGYIENPLVTKRAGEWDQLSEKYNQIERFRLQGLEHLVESGWFRHNCSDSSREKIAIEEYYRKCLIYSQGCAKRGKEDEAVLWAKKIPR